MKAENNPESIKPNSSTLMNAFFQEEENSIVKAEDVVYEGGMNFSEIFFEPQVGKSYLVKLVRNIHGSNVTLRKVYKDLPDPKRKGKTFNYVSSGSAKTCKVLDLFFELNNKKKEGDVLSEQLIEKFLKVTNQGVVIVQIIESPEATDVGKYKLMSFATFGPNATIANLINSMLNPTEAKIKAGESKIDVFNIFDSPLLMIECAEADYDGRKGRDFTDSSFTTKKTQGCYVDMGDGKIHQFSPADIVDTKTNQLTPEATTALNILVEILNSENLSVHNWFEYKEAGDERNFEQTDEYIVNLNAKIEEIVPVIANAKSVVEVLNYGQADTTANDSAKTISGNKAADILAGSIPDELTNSALNTPKSEETPNTANISQTSPEIDVAGILNK